MQYYNIQPARQIAWSWHGTIVKKLVLDNWSFEETSELIIFFRFFEIIFKMAAHTLQVMCLLITYLQFCTVFLNT